MVTRVNVVVPNARGVAERWRSAYQHGDRWTRTVSGDCEQIYNKLCDLGKSPDPDMVAGIIGNKSWTHQHCSGCFAEENQMVSFGTDYSDNEVILCKACLQDGLRALSN